MNECTGLSNFFITAVIESRYMVAKLPFKAVFREANIRFSFVICFDYGLVYNTLSEIIAIQGVDVTTTAVAPLGVVIHDLCVSSD